MTKAIKFLIQNIFSEHDNWKIQLLKNWPTILGNLSSKVQLEKINEDSLILGVIDSCWLQELYMLSPLLLQTINQKLDVPRIKHLRFKKVGIKKQPKKRVTSKQQKETIHEVQLTPKQQQALNNIKDPALSIAIKDFLRRCQQET